MNDDEHLNYLNLSLTSSGEGGKTKTIQQCLVCVCVYIYIYIYKTNLTMFSFKKKTHHTNSYQMYRYSQPGDCCHSILGYQVTMALVACCANSNATPWHSGGACKAAQPGCLAGWGWTPSPWYKGSMGPWETRRWFSLEKCYALLRYLRDG